MSQPQAELRHRYQQQQPQPAYSQQHQQQQNEQMNSREGSSSSSRSSSGSSEGEQESSQEDAWQPDAKDWRRGGSSSSSTSSEDDDDDGGGRRRSKRKKQRQGERQSSRVATAKAKNAPPPRPPRVATRFTRSALPPAPPPEQKQEDKKQHRQSQRGVKRVRSGSGSDGLEDGALDDEDESEEDEEEEEEEPPAPLVREVDPDMGRTHMAEVKALPELVLCLEFLFQFRDVLRLQCYSSLTFHTLVDALVFSTGGPGSGLLAQLHTELLQGIVSSKNLSEDNWQHYLAQRLALAWSAISSTKHGPPPFVAEKGKEAEAYAAMPATASAWLGVDGSGFSYWWFDWMEPLKEEGLQFGSVLAREGPLTIPAPPKPKPGSAVASPLAAGKAADRGGEATTEGHGEQVHQLEAKEVPTSGRMEGNGGDAGRGEGAENDGDGARAVSPGLVSGEDQDKGQGSRGKDGGGMKGEEGQEGTRVDRRKGPKEKAREAENVGKADATRRGNGTQGGAGEVEKKGEGMERGGKKVGGKGARGAAEEDEKGEGKGRGRGTATGKEEEEKEGGAKRQGKEDNEKGGKKATVQKKGGKNSQETPSKMRKPKPNAMPKYLTYHLPPLPVPGSWEIIACSLEELDAFAAKISRSLKAQDKDLSSKVNDLLTVLRLRIEEAEKARQAKMRIAKSLGTWGVDSSLSRASIKSLRKNRIRGSAVVEAAGATQACQLAITMHHQPGMQAYQPEIPKGQLWERSAGGMVKPSIWMKWVRGAEKAAGVQERGRAGQRTVLTLERVWVRVRVVQKILRVMQR
ncbi:hypothetical protein DUNSADRAFT_815 [Dunaliella salina]|uniref:DDT domain-containing protein n=1 Tax=Dunaliella salina TaxID=3046 RepID=A0ABQ7GXV8_DUNSA|nr:hypothetical protein DUNSADRAFT_815 [Dunaliella salina]|eukprot:KAF5839412.1 hypothetical protein DUNSADRAFT_815 [Dunaliella salina]